MDDAIEILKILWESYVLLLLFIIIPIVLLVGSWIFGSRIGDEVFSDKYLKESFDVFKTLMIFYFLAILFVILFIYVVK
tara:strand:- start:20 stop:256 length:237 start_codon:yes stop_codon:yes gene_type:complete